MFLRDLFTQARRATARQRLEFAPEEPAGDINRSFFRLVEESGTTLDMAHGPGHGDRRRRSSAWRFRWSSSRTCSARPAAGPRRGDSRRATCSSSAGGGSASMRKHLPYALQAVADAVRSGQNAQRSLRAGLARNQRPAGPGIRLRPFAARAGPCADRRDEPHGPPRAAAGVPHLRDRRRRASPGGRQPVAPHRTDVEGRSRPARRPQSHAGRHRRQPACRPSAWCWRAIIAAGRARLDGARIHRRRS